MASVCAALARLVMHNPKWDRVGSGEILREFHREMDRVAKRKREPEEEEGEMPDLCDPTCTQLLHTPLRQGLGCDYPGGHEP
jgi:hypothetical protein